MSYALRKILTIRSKEFHIWCKPDEIRGAMIKIEEMGVSRRTHSYNLRPTSTIEATLDATIELCHRLEYIDRECGSYGNALLYNDDRPILRNGQLIYAEISEPESTYQLDLSVNNYLPCFRITQNKPGVIRKPSATISIPDISVFREELTQIVDELSNNYLTSNVESDNGIKKLIRGNRVAVIYCPIRKWPCSNLYSEQLLFDPHLVALILFDRDVNKIREYCQRLYPRDLIPEASIGMNWDEWDLPFEDLKICWIHRGKKFRINDPVGTVALEDRWHTA